MRSLPDIVTTAIVAVAAVVGIAAFVEITPALASVFTAAITVIGQIAMTKSKDD